MYMAKEANLEITLWLKAWQHGDKQAESTLFRELEDRLKNMCRKRLAQIISGPFEMGSTEVFNELYMRLDAQTKHINWENRKHFFFIAGRLIRQILVDELRRNNASKRKGLHHTFTDALHPSEKPICLDALELALKDLGERSPELAQMVDLRFFFGMSFPEIAELLEMTEAQAKHRWRKSKTWLLYYLEK